MSRFANRRQRGLTAGAAAAQNVSAEAAMVLNATGQTLPGEGNIELIDYTVFSGKLLAASSNVQTLEFFTDPPSALTNVAQTNQLIQNDIFTAQALAFHFEVNTDDEVASDATIAAVNAAQARLIRGGTVIFNRGNNELWRVRGVGSFPAGGGPFWQGAAATTASTTTIVAGIMNNGVPQPSSIRRFSAPIVFTPAQSFKLTVQYDAPIAIPSGVNLNMFANLIGSRTRKPT